MFEDCKFLIEGGLSMVWSIEIARILVSKYRFGKKGIGCGMQTKRGNYILVSCEIYVDAFIVFLLLQFFVTGLWCLVA